MQSVYFHTFGCRTNQYDSENIRGKLLAAGYEVSDDFKNCDLCIVNSCTVTAEADKKCRQFVRKVLRSNQKARMVVTGCFATRAPQDLKTISPRIEVFSNHEKKSLAEMVSGCNLIPDHTRLISRFHGKTRAFVKVQDGCDAKCTYCIIPSVRPKMESRPIDEIQQEVRLLVSEGYKEIVLTGIRLGSFGLISSGARVGQVHGNLAHLLRVLVQIPESFRIRLSSLEITEVTEEILDLMCAHPDKICPHFHLPLQSGDDTVLRRMGRWYDMAFYRKTIEQILSRLPHAGLTTDVIVGFPGETDENFNNTLQFLSKYFHGLHVFPYSERPGTASIKLKETVSPSIQNQRMEKLLKLNQELRTRFTHRFSGTKRIVLCESDGGFTDNGIRLAGPFPFSIGEFGLVQIA